MTDTMSWWNWPDESPTRIPRAYSVSLQFARTLTDRAARAAVERAFGNALPDVSVDWEWLGLTAVAKVTSGGVDRIAALRNAVTAVARLETVHIASLHIPEPKRAKSATESLITTAPIAPSKLSDVPDAWHETREPPKWMGLGARPVFQHRLPTGAWLIIEGIARESTLSVFPHEGSAERLRVGLGMAVRKRVATVSPDGDRVLVALKNELVEFRLSDLARTLTIAIPRTPRDNNGFADADYASRDRFFLATESGVHLFDREGTRRAFVKSLDGMELALTRDRRIALVAKFDGPFRGEIFGIHGDEVRSLGRSRKLGTPFAIGNRLFAWTGPEKLLEILGADVAWERAFGRKPSRR